MPPQLPTETNLIVIPSFGRAYISPDAAEFANSRRRPAGGWYFGSRRLRSPTQAAPLVRCTGVVRSAATTACRGPAGESLICSIHRRWSAGCERSIAHHIAIRSQFVDVFRLIETGTIRWSSRKNHCQNSPLHPSFPTTPTPHLNNEAYTNTTPPPRASRCMTTHLNSFPTPRSSTLDSPPPVRIMRCST
jgi:hypothetical protein